ncbi:MAG: hypothetical protein QXF54_05660, partial [Candidatus Methanomethylicaceae archaeon]
MNNKFFFLEKLFKLILKIATLIIIIIFILMFISLIERSIPSFLKNGIYILIGTTWDVYNEIFGGAPAILATLFSSIIAVLFALPIS